MDVGQLLTLLLGGGAVATITTIFNGVKTLREGSRVRERDTIRDLVEQLHEAWEYKEFAISERDYWRDWAGTLEYIINSSGIELPQKPQKPIRKF